jgi:hypothetical protein
MGCPDRVGLVTGRAETGPVALLVRPDGYVAWAANGGADNPWSGAQKALRYWFGAEVAGRLAVTHSDEPVTQVGG